MITNGLIALLKNGKLSSKVFTALMKEFEAHATEVEERDEGVIYEFDYYAFSGDEPCGFIKKYKIYSDNTYSTTIVDEYHCETDENINYYNII